MSIALRGLGTGGYHAGAGEVMSVFRVGLMAPMVMRRRGWLLAGGALLTGSARAEADSPAESRSATDDPAPEVSAPEQAPPSPPSAESAGRLNIQLFGDSLAQGLFLSTNPVMRRREAPRLLNGTRHATGLTRADEHDWVAVVRESLSRTPPQLVFVWIGANDFRSFVDRANRRRWQFGTSNFHEAYRGAVQAISQAASEARAPLGWLGLPNMRDRAFADSARQLNDMIREGTQAAGGTYISTWEATSDADGRFRASIPGHDRLERRLRADDGVHFSDLGYRLMARLAFEKMAEARPPLATALDPAREALDASVA